MSDATRAHEISGVNVRGLGVFILCFVISGGVILIAIALFLGVIDRHVHHQESAPSPLTSAILFPAQQPLQPSPGHPTLDWQDTAAMKAAQTKSLNCYAPIAGDSVHARIPIDRAIHLLLDKQMLTRPGGLGIPSSTQPYINTTQPSPTENRT